MTLRVEQGKGRKDRYAMLSPVLLERLRAWWRQAHAQGKMLPGGWLFPGLNPAEPLTARQLNRAIHIAAENRELFRNFYSMVYELASTELAVQRLIQQALLLGAEPLAVRSELQPLEDVAAN